MIRLENIYASNYGAFVKHRNNINNNVKNNGVYLGLNPKPFIYKAATVPLLHTELFQR